MNSPLIRRAYRMLCGSDQSNSAFAALARNQKTGEMIVTAFYAASIYLSVQLIADVGKLAESTNTWNLLWVLSWAPLESAGQLFEVISVACAFSAVAALVWRHVLVARLVFFILFLLTASVPNSLGGINHPYHAWIFVSLIFVFLPSGEIAPENRAARMSYVTVIRTAQATMLLFYTMAGAAKLDQGLTALIYNKSGSLSYGALNWTLADRSIQTGTTPLMLDFLLANPFLATLMMWGVIYIQVVAVVVAFRPSLHAVWAFALISFHIGTWLLMEIIFTQHILLLAILFLLYVPPFTASNLVGMFRALPVVGAILSMLNRFSSQSRQQAAP